MDDSRGCEPCLTRRSAGADKGYSGSRMPPVAKKRGIPPGGRNRALPDDRERVRRVERAPRRRRAEPGSGIAVVGEVVAHRTGHDRIAERGRARGDGKVAGARGEGLSPAGVLLVEALQVPRDAAQAVAEAGGGRSRIALD